MHFGKLLVAILYARIQWFQQGLENFFTIAHAACRIKFMSTVNLMIIATKQDRKKTRCNCLRQINFALEQVKIIFSWTDGKVKLASVVLLVIISNQKQ